MAKDVLLSVYGVIGREDYTDGEGTLRLFSLDGMTSVPVDPTVDYPNSPGLSPVRTKITENPGSPYETSYLVQQTVAQIQAARNA